MKRILVILLMVPFAAAAQEGSKPIPPFQIFDNLYYVGLDSAVGNAG
jgi:hypothetical protein